MSFRCEPALSVSYDQLAIFAEFQDNWDEEDSLAIPPTIIDASRRFLSDTFVAAIKHSIPWSTPMISPSRKGEICLSWMEQSRGIAVVFHEHGIRVIESFGGNVKANEFNNSDMCELIANKVVEMVLRTISTTIA